jgi:hypothetical protein
MGENDPVEPTNAIGPSSKKIPKPSDYIAVLAILASLTVSLLTSKLSIIIFISLVIALMVSGYVYFYTRIAVHSIIFTWLILVVIILSLILFLPNIIMPRIIVRGVVHDLEDVPIIGEKITIVDSAGTPHETKTDKDGKFELKGVPKDTFTVRVGDIHIEGQPLGILEPEVSMNFTIPIYTPAPTPTPTYTPTPTPTPTDTPTPTVTPTPTSVCPYQGKTDDETIKNLIQAEAEAYHEESMAIIQSIFSPDAIIVDNAATPLPRTWLSPIERYQNDIFPNTDLKGVVHFDILPAGQGIAGDTASYTSGSHGYYRSSPEAQWTYFFNGSKLPPNSTSYGSDHWRLKKINGCWAITEFEFNSGHVPFP